MARARMVEKEQSLPLTREDARLLGAERIKIEIPAIQLITFDVLVVGDTPLIVHRFEEKAREEMRRKQGQLPQKKKEPKDPAAYYEAAFYRLPDGRYGFPASAFRQAMVAAAGFVENVYKTTTRGSFTIIEDDKREHLVAFASHSEPWMREDVVRLQGTTTDLRYRPQFDEWSVKLTFALMRGAGLSPSQLMQLLSIAGFSIGIGEWRPAKNGSNGRFLLQVGD